MTLLYMVLRDLSRVARRHPTAVLVLVVIGTIANLFE